MPDQIGEMRVELKTKSVSQISSRAIIATGFPISIIKGTGEASPVRGRDWAGFKFAAT